MNLSLLAESTLNGGLVAAVISIWICFIFAIIVAMYMLYHMAFKDKRIFLFLLPLMFPIAFTLDGFLLASLVVGIIVLIPTLILDLVIFLVHFGKLKLPFLDHKVALPKQHPEPTPEPAPEAHEEPAPEPEKQPEPTPEPEKEPAPQPVSAPASEGDEEEEEAAEVTDDEGNVWAVRYNRSFVAKLSLLSDEARAYYNELRNHFLSYKKVNARVSWPFDSVKSGRNHLAKFAIRGRTLCVYLNLEEADADPKYHLERVDSKKFAEVPYMIRVKFDRNAKHAMELFDLIAERNGLKHFDKATENFLEPKENLQQLMEKDQIREVRTLIKPGPNTPNFIKQ